MLSPGLTGSTASVLVTERSAAALTVVVSVDVLLPAVVSVVLETVAVLVSVVPFGVDGLTWTTSTNVCGPLPAGSVPRVLLTVPVPPTVGVVLLQPGGAVNETNVVPPGSASASDTVCASLGPALLTTIVYVRSLPAATGSGESSFVTETSAAVATVV